MIRKGLLIEFVIFLILVGYIFAQTKTSKIEFKYLLYNYGTINQGSSGSCVFPFKNTGTKPLVINKVNTSCGCTVAEYPKKPIMPGKQGVIKVNYNTSIVGSFRKVVIVSTDYGKKIVLTIKGTVKGK